MIYENELPSWKVAHIVRKLIEMMPKDKVRTDTFVLAERDLDNMKKYVESI